LIVDLHNNFLRSNGQFIALLGVDNLVVVVADDAILVINKERVEEVKKIVEYLKDNKEDLL
jgi:light-regulated signal transduction histidine kinase (bacteriophytochrome)